jgi:hypothetical protein
MMVFEKAIEGSTFQMPTLNLVDLTSSTSGVFFLTLNGVYAFQYGFGNIGNIRSYVLGYEAV